jgi:mono/diheme cytochrome c family protein
LEPPIIVALEPCPQSACKGATTEAYTGSSPGLRAAGRWRLRVAVRRTGEFDAIHTFGLEILSTLPRATDWSRVSLGFLLLGAVASRWALVGWKERGGIGQMLRWTPSAAMGALSLALLILPPTRGPADLVNPVPPTPDSVGRGAELYTQSCSLCHGPQGKGDGPVGVTLNPRPADLTLHTAPGVHSDGQLYLWISDGFPNSPMPAFRETISDEDRWNLVNYIRTLPQPTPFP